MKSDRTPVNAAIKEPRGPVDKIRTRWGFIFRSFRLNIRTLLACKSLIDDYRHELKTINLGERSPVGWFTYPFLEHLGSCDLSKSKVFEWGGGYSSLMWSDRCKKVVTVESNSQWFEYIKSRSLDLENMDLILAQDRDSYIGYFDEHRGSDIVLIDGRWRYDCAATVLEKISPSAVIILDNSEWCPDTCSLLRARGYARIDFPGFGPCNQFTWCTSIFFKSLDNPLLNPVNCPSSAGGILLERSGYMFAGEHEKAPENSEEQCRKTHPIT